MASLVDSNRSGAWARRGLLVAAVLSAAALAVSSWAGYSTVQGATRIAARGQGEMFLHAVGRAVHDAGGTLSEETARALLAANEKEGLRFLGRLGRDGQLDLLVGTPLSTRDAIRHDARSLRPGAMSTVGDRVRMVFHPQPPPRRDRPPPGPPRRDDADSFDEPPPPPPRGSDEDHGAPPPPPPPSREGQPGGENAPPHGPPEVVIEFEPLVANALRREAARTLGTGFAAAVLLLGSSLGLLRWMLGREAEAKRRSHEERLLALGEMSAVLAHEIRNPLTSLKGHAQLLVESMDEGDRGRVKAERVVRETMRLETLTRDLLEFARLGRIERRPTSPAELLRAVVEELDEGRFVVEASRAPATFPLDPERIRQILTNLLRNAVQASPEGERVEAAVSLEGGRLFFRVRDHGAGIAPGEEERIFRPFHTTRVRGVGLGLAVARRIAELHDGTITASNHADGGALFEVAIPPRGPRAKGERR